MEAEKEERVEEKKADEKDASKRAYGEPKLTKFGPVEEFTGSFVS